MTEELTCKAMINGNKHYYNAKGYLVRTEHPNGKWEKNTRADDDYILRYEDSNGYWCEYTRDERGNQLSVKDSDGFSSATTYDKNNQLLTFRNSSGDWREFTRDEFGNVLTYKDPDGGWRKYTRDSEAVITGYEDQDGVVDILASDKQYYLHFKSGRYHAGCRIFLYKEAVEHWTERSQDEDAIIKARAIKFLAAIEKHQNQLKNI